MATTRQNFPAGAGDAGKGFIYDFATDRMVLTPVVKSGDLFINVKDPPYGAKGDGTTVDTAAIQAAIDAAYAAGGGIVFLPAGTYPSGTLNIKNYVTLEGTSGSVLKTANGVNAHLLQTQGFAADDAAATPNGGQHHFEIRDLRIDGNKANNSAGNGLALYGFAYKVHNVHISDCKGKGIYTHWVNGGGTGFRNGTEGFFTDTTVYYCDGDGVHFKGPHDSQISNCIFAQCGGRQLRVDVPGYGIVLDAVHCWAAATAPNTVYVVEVRATTRANNCYFEGDGTAGVLLLACSDNIVGDAFLQGWTAGQTILQMGETGGVAGNCIVTGKIGSATSGVNGIAFTNEANSIYDIQLYLVGASTSYTGTASLLSHLKMSIGGINDKVSQLLMPRTYIRPFFMEFENLSAHVPDPAANESHWYEKGGKAIFQYGDTRSVADGAMGTASTTLTSATAVFTAADQGKAITVSGAGVAAATLSTTVATFTNATTVTLTAPNASGAPVTGAAVNLATTRYKWLELFGGSVTWQTSTTAP